MNDGCVHVAMPFYVFFVVFEIFHILKWKI